MVKRRIFYCAKPLIRNGRNLVTCLLQECGKPRMYIFIQFNPHGVCFMGMSTYRSRAISAA